MAIREDLVASAAKFLQDPNVASSPPDSRVAFLKAKNLTPEEIGAALSRAGLDGAAPSYAVAPQQQSVAPQHSPVAPPPYYGSPYGQQPYPPYGWQPPPHEAPRRDWRDWFIMATVVSGVGYGLYSLTKRYVYPLVAPPTPDRLEQDKQEVNAQFERAFALVDQLAKDTEALKAAEQERTSRIDEGLTMLETALSDLKAAGKRREDDAERLRDDVRNLKDALPKALEAQRDVTDNRLRDVNTELKGLKTLVGQRLATAAPTPTPAPSAAIIGAGPGFSTVTSTYTAGAKPDTDAAMSTPTPVSVPAPASGFMGNYMASDLTTPASSGLPVPTSPTTTPPQSKSPLSGAAGRASIPEWQRAMMKKSTTGTNGNSAATTNGTTNGTAAGTASSVHSASSSS
ncbi:peroxisomal membrane anchor protein [Grosmannia clavigera kw1407]|uniref:Peroxisomal membrane protein PEX14 n=1 Tax=Grosmannia clavigera (strain kw1407 / UAMH 11150) TaxID=655863 RepID=F0XLC6_GROCL|nr:peroxisomal membrane anchor protein [Grosmannia clavigera kw1407]EFX01547.1 peroxisomal membrane anchor protein [Grosmannia clavigera kw1407]